MKVLKESDIFISTADHEFFGIAAVEAVAAGCIPVVPEHLAYPEVLSEFHNNFYKPRSSVSLLTVLETVLSKRMNINVTCISKYLWGEISSNLDASI